MPKKIKVLARTLNYQNKLLGKNGEYVVNDAFAREKVIDGSAEIVEDLGIDSPFPNSGKQLDENFIGKVRYHAAEILAILKEESDHQEGKVPEPPNKADDTSSSEVETVPEIEETEETVSSSESTVPSDEPGGIVTATDNSNNVSSNLIPDDFPGSQLLIKNGITTLDQLEALGYDQLIEKGIPAGTANQIGAKLAGLKK